MADARAELCRQSASGDGEDRRPRPAIQPQAAPGGSAGRQARTGDLDEPDAERGWFCIEIDTLYSLEKQIKYVNMA